MRKILGVLSVLLLFLITAPAQIQPRAGPELSQPNVVQLDVDLVATDLAIEAFEFTRYDVGDRPQLIDSRIDAVGACTDARAIADGPHVRRSRSLYNLRL